MRHRDVFVFNGQTLTLTLTLTPTLREGGSGGRAGNGSWYVPQALVPQEVRRNFLLENVTQNFSDRTKKLRPPSLHLINIQA